MSSGNDTDDEIVYDWNYWYNYFCRGDPDDYDVFSETWYYKLTYWTIGSIFPFVLSSFGVVTNIINIVVFYRQGILSDNCTPILVGLAISDFCCCVIVCFETLTITTSTLWYGLVKSYSRPVNNFSYLGAIVSWPGPMFKMISSYVTAFLAFERMVSVTFPFDVKTLFTPTRCCVVQVFIFGITFLLNVPSLFLDKMTLETDEYGLDIDYEYSGLISDEFKHKVKIVNDLILRPICMSSVILFNTVIMVKVALSRKFRNSAANSSSNQQKTVQEKGMNKNTNTNKKDESNQNRSINNNKEMKLVKMMIVLCILFVVAYIPRVVNSLGLYVLEHFSNLARYYIHPVNMFVEIANSSINIIIYYKMSTRYRTELLQLCSCCHRK